MANQATIVSTACLGEPELSFRHDNGKWRALLGWNHVDDTADGIEKGKVWCWVSNPPEKFQVYDSQHNRPTSRGERRDCGPANFSMVRMIHPFWSCNGRAPRDLVSKDKRWCRKKYKQLMRKHRLAQGLPFDEDPAEYARRIMQERQERQKQRKANAELKRQLVAAKKTYEQRLADELELPGFLEVVAGGSADDAMYVTDDGEEKVNKSTIRDEEYAIRDKSGSRVDPIHLD